MHSRDVTRRGALLVCAAVFAGAVLATGTPVASAKPAPEAEYAYDVLVRRHFDFPGNDALGYGYRICDDVARAVPYAALLERVKADPADPARGLVFDGRISEDFKLDTGTWVAVGALRFGLGWKVSRNLPIWTSSPLDRAAEFFGSRLT